MSELADVDVEPLPTLMTVPASFARRLPAQSLIDLLRKLEPGSTFGELAEQQPFRLMAFRALRRDYPRRDPASLWMHAYEVEIDVDDVDPTNGSSPITPLLSAATGGAFPTTSTG